jgi:small ligand-binding sensory domain FIST
MQQFLFASAQDNDAVSLIKQCLEQIGPIPTQASLGFVYATDLLANDMQEILARLRQCAPDMHWLGTVGLGICSSGLEIYDRPALAIMISDIANDAFRIIPEFNGQTDELSVQINDWYHAQDFCFALLHADPGNSMTPEWIEKLRQEQGIGFINGGLTSSNSEHVQVADGIHSGGISGVLFNGTVHIVTDHTQGCSPIGPVHEITRAERNIVMTLDRQTAVAVMKEDIGEVLAKDLSRIGGYIFAALPLAESDTGDYLVRQLIGIDPEHGMLAIGDILDRQQRLMFCRRDGNSAREDMERMLERLAQRKGEQQIRGGIYISCLGRGRHQFGENSEELKMIQQYLGDFPLLGFFANGEIYNGRLYGYTGVLTLFL